MHKFLLPSIDSFISNQSNVLKNYGRDEILEISSNKIFVRSFVTTSFTSTNTNYIGLELLGFIGNFTGSLTGSGTVSGSIIGSGMVLPATSSC